MSEKKGLDGRVLVGKIVRAHGIKGDVYIHPFSDNPDRFSAGGSLELADGSRVEITRSSKHATKNLYRVHLKDVDTRNDAEALVGQNVYVRESELPELEEDEFYIFQLVGMAVYDLSGNLLGTVKDLLQTGGIDVLRISRVEEKKELLVPFAKEFVKDISVKDKKVVIDTSQLEDLL
ncbi:16S rRNA processing protein RimM [bacterium 3DAC]|jgi:16S rRNA processing protein RimM|nr:16S rRNA processing protein RimM [Dictyoglomota bacterium]UZN23107.1 16S rRNA processing protein RimM [bacterium 3DAC]